MNSFPVSTCLVDGVDIVSHHNRLEKIVKKDICLLHNLEKGNSFFLHVFDRGVERTTL